MMHENEPQDNSELLKRAMRAIDQLQAKLAQIEMARHEPIAIIGIGCRFPGADGADAFWRNLIEGVDSVTEVPSCRWDVEDVFDPDPDAIGKAYTKWGGFLKDVDLFDAPFFGITPREAACLDPQQRQVMESSWLALEDAGIAPSSVANTRTGVYLGLSGLDYFQMLSRTYGIRAESFTLSGTAHSIAGGRVSYFLGAQGPNISIDTACSSSLVAVHLAVKGLRAREADMALAGGVNITLLADASIITSRARMMSPTGRCNAFDESADGYVRSEGGAMIVLKRLSDAQRDGNRILALIRGTALNQDGRSSGLTAPHGPSQEAVVRAALEDAGLTASEIAFVEAHGTGTSLGDPIEVNALGKVFADRPADRPLIIGSVKANIGHTEAAAGIAGLIKAVQALRHRALPRQLHVNVLNPMINWDSHPGPCRIGDNASRATLGRTTLLRSELIRVQRHERARHSAGGAACRNGGCAAPRRGRRHDAGDLGAHAGGACRTCGPLCRSLRGRRCADTARGRRGRTACPLAFRRARRYRRG